MIVCPNCKAEIEDDSRFCDQCGQMLLYCEKCGRVGMGRRCTSCGGMMLSATGVPGSMPQGGHATDMSVSRMSMSGMGFTQSTHATSPRPLAGAMPGAVSTRGGVSSRGITGGAARGAGMGMGSATMPQLHLSNDSLGIRIVGINGAVIGRKEGPYAHFLKQQSYISGVHAQLFYRADIGWCLADKHSSNGTKLNNHRLQPDVEMSLKNGDIVTLANVVLKVNVI